MEVETYPIVKFFFNHFDPEPIYHHLPQKIGPFVHVGFDHTKKRAKTWV